MENNAHCKKEGDIAALKSDIKTIFKRMDEQLTITKAVYDLTAEIRVMNSRLETIESGQRQLKEDVDSVKVIDSRLATIEKGQIMIKEDVEEMKAKPGKRWDSMVGAIIAAVVSLIVGTVIGGNIG
jgi:hypothetical protein